MLQFAPQSEEDLLNLLPDGEYDFKVKQSTDHRSQSSGNESIKLQLDVYDAKMRPHIVFCYLSANYAFLLKHFCDATGLEENYQQGNLSAGLCENRTGRCKVIIEQPAEGTNYLPKNVIKDFIKRSLTAGIQSLDKKDDFQDSEIPF